MSRPISYQFKAAAKPDCLKDKCFWILFKTFFYPQKAFNLTGKMRRLKKNVNIRYYKPTGV